jgi:hypothetical protein
MSRLVLACAPLAAALLACGGTTPPPAPPAPEPSEAERKLVAEAEALAADVCACKDLECLVAAVDDRWAPTFQEPPIDLVLTDPGAARYARAYLGTSSCVRKLTGDAEAGGGAGFSDATNAAIADLTAIRDRACACKDLACTDKVMEDFMALGERHKDTKGSDRAVEQFKDLFEQMQECIAQVQVENGDTGGAAAP